MTPFKNPTVTNETDKSIPRIVDMEKPIKLPEIDGFQGIPPKLKDFEPSPNLYYRADLREGIRTKESHFTIGKRR